MRSVRCLLFSLAVPLTILSVAACKPDETETKSSSTSTGMSTAAPQAAAPALTPPAGADIPFSVPPPQAGHVPFADFAWRSFIALNWPSQLNAGLPVRGVPDRTLSVGDALDRPRVWETWKTDWELFGFGGPSPPTPSRWPDWSTPGIQPCPGMTLRPGTKVLTTQGSAATKIRGLNQAFIGPLIDQNRNYARYEIRVNENEYETIRTRQWFIRSNIPNPVVFDSSRPGSYGAIELKAAWRELTAGEDGSRFYNVAAWKLDPGTTACVQTRVALIGFHIAHKTAPFSEWVWSTFEHVDNVPPNPPGTPQAGVRYSFNNGTITPPTPNGFDRVPAELRAGVALPPPADPARNPIQVTRFEPTPTEVQNANRTFRTAAPVAGTVWANYFLVNNQWPTRPGTSRPGGRYPADAGDPFPSTKVANTTMETYFQNKLVTDSTNSCMSCHYISIRRDFSYVFLDAWAPPPPPAPAGVAAERALEREPEELRELRKALDATRSQR